MTTELESRLVFIDTSAFESKNFQFGVHALGRLAEFLKSGDLHLLMTDITINEIKAQLMKKADEAAGAIKKIQKESMFLRNTPELPCYGIFQKVSGDEIYSIVVDKFQEFLDIDTVEVISIQGVDASIVFEKYF